MICHFFTEIPVTIVLINLKLILGVELFIYFCLTDAQDIWLKLENEISD